MRPRRSSTTGAGVAVPFAWIGRLLGARVVYVESVTRIEAPSLSCRLIRPVATRVYVQWPELLQAAAGARYVGQRLRRAMIFVTLGTHEASRSTGCCARSTSCAGRRGARRPVRRLRRAGRAGDAGSTYARRSTSSSAYVRQARVVVAHAGVGSVMTAARERQAPRRRAAAARASARRSTTTRSPSPAGSREAGLVTLVEDVDRAWSRPSPRGRLRRPRRPQSTAGRALALDASRLPRRGLLLEVAEARAAAPRPRPATRPRSRGASRPRSSRRRRTRAAARRASAGLERLVSTRPSRSAGIGSPSR